MPECKCGTPRLCTFICCCMRRQQGSRMGRHRVCLFGVALLTAAVGFAAWAQPQQVNGVLGGTVLLSPALPLNKMVKEIEWSISDGDGATIRVAEFGPGGFECPDPKDRFKDQLEMFNKMALKIRALEWGDSGVYGARIKLQPALVEDQFFNLSNSGDSIRPSCWITVAAVVLLAAYATMMEFPQVPPRHHP